VIGHVYPVFAAFKGGKGIACLFGVFLYLLTIPVLMSLGVFIIIFLSSGYVSVGSIVGGILLPLFTIIVNPKTPIHLIVFAFIISAFVIYTHRKNISRLKKGEENRFVIFRKH
jgi:glycerol-3-phosphate acyltransferase PlsY